MARKYEKDRFSRPYINDIPIEKSAEYFNDMCARKGYEVVGVMALLFFIFIREVYIIARSAISYRRYITRSNRNG